MKVNRFVVVCVIPVCLLVSLAWAWAETLEVISNSDFINPRQPPVAFMHDEHNDMAGLDDCAVCHHLYEGNTLIRDESSEDMSCSECHPAVHFSRQAVSLTAAYHKRCKGCHLTIRQGPIVCGQCHRKELAMNNE